MAEVLPGEYPPPIVNLGEMGKAFQRPVLRIRNRDPVPFLPLDPDPGSGIGFFWIPDPNPIFFRA
jgi:hypothetical protein